MVHEVTPLATLRAKTASLHLLPNTRLDKRLLAKNKTSQCKEKRFFRLTACFAFVSKFKKPKVKHQVTEQASISAGAAHDNIDDLSLPNVVSPGHQKLIPSTVDDEPSIASTVQPWKTLQATPASALSPPPRSKKERTCSMMPVSSESLLILQHPPEKTMLRLSLDLDHHFSSLSHSSSDLSTASAANTQKEDNEYEADTTSSVNTTSTLATVNRAKIDSLVTPVRSRGALRLTPNHQQHLATSDNHLPLAATAPAPDSQQASSTPAVPTAPLSAPTHPLPSCPSSSTISSSSSSPLTSEHTHCSNDTPLNDHDDEYTDLLSRFQLPSNYLLTHSNSWTARRPSSKKEITTMSKEDHPRHYSIALTRQQTMPVLEQDFMCASKSMDIIREKAYYDAVVSGTLQRRPWAQFAASKSKVDGTSQCHDQIRYGEHARPRTQRGSSAKKPRATSAIIVRCDSISMARIS